MDLNALQMRRSQGGLGNCVLNRLILRSGSASVRSDDLRFGELWESWWRIEEVGPFAQVGQDALQKIRPLVSKRV